MCARVYDCLGERVCSYGHFPGQSVHRCLPKFKCIGVPVGLRPRLKVKESWRRGSEVSWEPKAPRENAVASQSPKLHVIWFRDPIQIPALAKGEYKRVVQLNVRKISVLKGQYGVSETVLHQIKRAMHMPSEEPTALVSFVAILQRCPNSAESSRLFERNRKSQLLSEISCLKTLKCLLNQKQNTVSFCNFSFCHLLTCFLCKFFFFDSP